MISPLFIQIFNIVKNNTIIQTEPDTEVDEGD